LTPSISGDATRSLSHVPDSQYSLPHFRLTDLGPPNGKPWIDPVAVNNNGAVVGNTGVGPLSSLPCPPKICTAPPQGFVFRDGHLHQLRPLPGGVESFAADINDNGVIAGGSVNANGVESAVLWNPDGSMVNLGTGIATPGSNAEADSISNTGVIAGVSYSTTAALPTIFDGKGGATDPCGSRVQGYFRAVNDAGIGAGDELLSGGGTAAMTCPPFKAVERPSNSSWLDFGFDINDSGTVVGRFSPGPSFAIFHPFRYKDGVTTDLGSLFPDDSSAVGAAFAIDNVGLIVGFSAKSGGVIGSSPVPPKDPRAFIYANGRMINLNNLLPAGYGDWTLITAESISDNGNIVGTAFVGGYPNGYEHAYLLTPQY
jgi:probable HAF family extracellular repeat protein